jgi:hypothetical protein
MLPNMAKYSVGPDNVHFNGAGCAFLAKQVSSVLADAIAGLKR